MNFAIVGALYCAYSTLLLEKHTFLLDKMAFSNEISLILGKVIKLRSMLRK